VIFVRKQNKSQRLMLTSKSTFITKITTNQEPSGGKLKQINNYKISLTEPNNDLQNRTQQMIE
jgi:hypothetical protein